MTRLLIYLKSDDYCYNNSRNNNFHSGFPVVSKPDLVAVAIVFSVFLVLMVICFVICRCKRKKIKESIRKIWPRLPTPNMLISFQTDFRDSNGSSPTSVKWYVLQFQIMLTVILTVSGILGWSMLKNFY